MFTQLVLLVVAVWVAIQSHHYESRLHRAAPRFELKPEDETYFEREGYKYVNLSLGRTRYAFSDASFDWKPCVVLIHGLGGPMEVMKPLRDYLRDVRGRRVLMFDLYGRGYSDLAAHSDPGPRAEVFVGQLAELLFALQGTTSIRAGEKFDVIGLSMGGLIAHGFARTYPERVNKLVLLAPLSFSPKSSMNHVKVISSLPTYMIENVVSRLVVRNQLSLMKDEFLVPGKFASDPALGAEMIDHIKNHQHPIKLTHAMLETVCNLDFEAVVESYERDERYRGDVLVMWGTLDSLAPYANAKRFEALLLRPYRSVKLVTVEGGGHMLTAREESIREIDAFLSS